MRIPFILFVFFIGLWLLLALFLVGLIPLNESISGQIMGLDLPKNTAELGESLTILDGLFSSIAIVFGLMAILLQGRELKEQIRLQTESNKLAALAARLQFLSQEVVRLKNDDKDLEEEIKETTDEAEKAKKINILKNIRLKRKNYLKKLNESNLDIIDVIEEITELK